MKPTGSHPDQLDGEELLARVEGDALQIVSLTREHGADVLHRLFDVWGEQHLRRVAIALAAAVKDRQTPQELWGWLGEPVTNRMTTTVRASQLWNDHDPFAPNERPSKRCVSPETRAGMADRARRNGAARWQNRANA